MFILPPLWLIYLIFAGLNPFAPPLEQVTANPSTQVYQSANTSAQRHGVINGSYR